MALAVRELSPEIKDKFTEAVIGQVTCPYCKQNDIVVINDDGLKDNKAFSYLENHDTSNNSGELCHGSNQMLRHFD